ncbi:hypothetical protein [Spirosoma horti]
MQTAPTCVPFFYKTTKKTADQESVAGMNGLTIRVFSRSGQVTAVPNH